MAQLDGLGGDCLVVYALAVVTDFHEDGPALVAGLEGDRPGLRLARGGAIGGRLDAVVAGVADDVGHGVGEELDDRPVHLDLVSVEDQVELFPGAPGHVPDNSGKVVEEAADRLHAGKHHRFLDLAGHRVDTPAAALDQGEVLGADRLRKLVARQDQLAGYVHEGFEDPQGNPHARVDAFPPELGGFRLRSIGGALTGRGFGDARGCDRDRDRDGRGRDGRGRDGRGHHGRLGKLEHGHAAQGDVEKPGDVDHGQGAAIENIEGEEGGDFLAVEVPHRHAVDGRIEDDPVLVELPDYLQRCLAHALDVVDEVAAHEGYSPARLPGAAQLEGAGGEDADAVWHGEGPDLDHLGLALVGQVGRREPVERDDLVRDVLRVGGTGIEKELAEAVETLEHHVDDLGVGAHSPRPEHVEDVLELVGQLPYVGQVEEARPSLDRMGCAEYPVHELLIHAALAALHGEEVVLDRREVVHAFVDKGLEKTGVVHAASRPGACQSMSMCLSILMRRMSSTMSDVALRMRSLLLTAARLFAAAIKSPRPRESIISTPVMSMQKSPELSAMPFLISAFITSAALATMSRPGA